MSRLSTNEVVNGIVKNGFDYDLQVWIKDFIIFDCGHRYDCGCNSRRFAGHDIREAYIIKEGD